MTRNTKKPVERMQGSGTEMAVRWSNDTVTALMHDPSVSQWLKTAVRALIQRDPLDALYDAELLCALMKDRWELSAGLQPDTPEPPEAQDDGG